MFRRFSRTFSLVLGLFIAAPLTAQTANDCSGWVSSARNIPEPFEQYTRTYANGEIRVILLDTIEPALGAVYLMVIAPPYDEMGNRNCAVISQSNGLGFADMFFDQIGASYDPASGLTIRLPIERFAPDTGGTDPAILAVTINQAIGTIVPFVEIP
jgi:hypothetical protein